MDTQPTSAPISPTTATIATTTTTTPTIRSTPSTVLRYLFTTIALAVVILSVIMSVLFATENYVSPPRVRNLGPLIDTPPTSALDPNGSFVYGRYRRPLTGLDYERATGSYWHPYFTLKQWQYNSINTNKYYIGIAIAQLGYLANGFAYIVDKTSMKKYEFTALSPFGIAVKAFPMDSTHGCSEWDGHGARIKLCYPTPKSTSISFDGLTRAPDGSDVQIVISATETRGQGLAMLIPIEPNRPGYTHKDVGMVVSGTIKIGDNAAESFTGVAGLDFTKSLSERITTWKWCSMSHTTEDGTRIGVNFADDIYEDSDGVSQENAVWVNGVVHLVGRVAFDLPATELQLVRPWTIMTVAHDEPVTVNLTFTPQGSREEHVHLGVVGSDFVQPYGKFEGSIIVRSADGRSSTYHIRNGFGVTENHFAKW